MKETQLCVTSLGTTAISPEALEGVRAFAGRSWFFDACVLLAVGLGDCVFDETPPLRGGNFLVVLVFMVLDLVIITIFSMR